MTLCNFLDIFSVLNHSFAVQGPADQFSLFSRFTDDGIRWICELIEREENKNRGPEDAEGKKEGENVSD